MAQAKAACSGGACSTASAAADQPRVPERPEDAGVPERCPRAPGTRTTNSAARARPCHTSTAQAQRSEDHEALLHHLAEGVAQGRDDTRGAGVAWWAARATSSPGGHGFGLVVHHHELRRPPRTPGPRCPRPARRPRGRRGAARARPARRAARAPSGAGRGRAHVLRGPLGLARRRAEARGEGLGQAAAWPRGRGPRRGSTRGAGARGPEVAPGPAPVATAGGASAPRRAWPGWARRADSDASSSKRLRARSPSARPPRRRPRPAASSAQVRTGARRARARAAWPRPPPARRRRRGAGRACQQSFQKPPTRRVARRLRDHQEVAGPRAGHVEQAPRLGPGALLLALHERVPAAAAGSPCGSRWRPCPPPTAG